MRMIWASMVSAPTFSARNWKLPFWLIVPANTFSPSFLSTGTGSPLSILSSTYEVPLMTIPSTAIFSPGLTRMVSFLLTCSIGISIWCPPSCTIVTVLGCNPISFFMAEDVLPFAFSSSNFPSSIKVITTEAASKYTWACNPRSCQKCGNTVLNTLKIYATPVLRATRVSILAERCFVCFHALIKKSFPNHNTTGVDSIHMI